MAVFISSTAETRDRREEGAATESRSTGDGVGIGTLKMRTEDQRVVYATSRGIKTSMLEIKKDRTVDYWRRARCLTVSD